MMLQILRGAAAINQELKHYMKIPQVQSADDLCGNDDNEKMMRCNAPKICRPADEHADGRSAFVAKANPHEHGRCNAPKY